MRLELFNDGTAMFTEKTPMHDVVIEVNGSGFLNIGDRTYPIIDGKAFVGELPQGDYPISIISNDKVYRAKEHLLENNTGMASVDDSHLWEIVLDLKEMCENLTKRLEKAEKIIQHHEERISGYTLFD